MCGICGFTYRDGPLIRRMSEAIRHRGPDDEGVYVSDDVSLGHRRLSVIDLTYAGHQPMSTEDRSLVIVFNGEIYNYRDIRSVLVEKGHRFKGNSDTEVILYAYKEWGRKCLAMFRGMFAFALWDATSKELFVARDRLGVKPLYYIVRDGAFFFASEIKAFKEAGLIGNELDYGAVNLYFTFRFTPGGQTVLKEVKKLEPGHFLVWKDGRAMIEKYWDIEVSDGPVEKFAEERYVEEFLSLFKESTRLRLVSDLPVGAFLSGGLDSSFIVGIMAGMMEKPVSTFSVGFPEGADESPYSRIVADHFHTDHHMMNLTANAVDVIPDAIWHMDEPVADAAIIPTFLMSQAAKKEVTVILSGEGADEQLGGYDKYKALYYPQRYKNTYPKFLFKAISPYSHGHPKTYRAAEYLGNIDDPSLAYLRLNSVFLPEERKRLFSPGELRDEVSKQMEMQIVRKYMDRKGDFLNRLLLLDLKTWLPDDILLKSDKMTMAHAVEARTPFLDHKLVEFLIKVPGSLKLYGFREKYLLRRSMEGVVPDSIIKRKKQGFSVPVHKWVEKELKGLVDDLFTKKNIEGIGFIEHNAVKELPGKDLTNPYNLRQFWTVFSFLAWHRYFLRRH